ncbi:MAG: 6-hydroxymethylpterin diphosphokinase MptE-like protein, partial [Spirochaetia bacterium]
MIETFTAKSGALTARVDGIALHSPYDPAREARRFVEASVGQYAPSTVVVLGEGLGYVTAAVKSLYPDARLMRIFYSNEIMMMGNAQGAAAGRKETGAVTRGGAGPAWCPGMSAGLGEFLAASLGELDLEGLRLIEWPPSARIFPAVSRNVNESIHRLVQELNGSFATTLAAGRLWIRNALSNFLAIDSTLVGELCPAGRPVLIAAPGPSLEEAASLIAELRSRVELWALASSSLLLRDRGISPDLVVMTDPGYYSLHHVQFSTPSCPFVMPLSAARGAWDLPWMSVQERPAAPFLLAQPAFFEKALLEEAGIRAPLIAPHGTVAATALDLALGSTGAPVIVAGLDMCTRDISLHARPNAFDRLLHLHSSRLTPHYSLSYQRAAAQRMEQVPGAAGVRASPSLRTYAGWFNDLRHDVGARIYRLFPSRVPLEGMRTLDASSLRQLLDGSPESPRGPRLRRYGAFPPRDQRHQVVSRLLKGWTDELARAHATASSLDKLDLLGHSPSLLSLAYHI